MADQVGAPDEVFLALDVASYVLDVASMGLADPRCVKRRDAKQAAFTVAECFAESALAGGRNDEFTPAAVGQFNYIASSASGAARSSTETIAAARTFAEV